MQPGEPGTHGAAAGLDGLLADLDRLTDRLDGADPGEHVAVLEDAHRRLREALDARAS